jgi:uncharacterized protein YggT (Ycf19 family)
MLTFAGDFWPLFWTVIGIGAVLSTLLASVVAKSWPQQRNHDAMLVELADAYRAAAEREHAHAA